jgi:hypothetical protein
MKSFSQFLKESEGEGIHTLFHPVRGMYKVHKDGEYHHIKNDEGEVTHTFVGKTDDEVINILKHEHDLIYAGKLHEEYIVELKAPKTAAEQARARDSKEININRGSYNEAMVAYHLNGKRWINKEHKAFADHHKKILSDFDKKHGSQEVKAQEDRAPEQAKSFLEHAKQRGYDGIEAVHHTAKPGEIEAKTDIKATQQENPSDVVVKFKKKPATAKHGYLGLSLKSARSKEIGFHNGGVGEIGKLIGHDLAGHIKREQEKFMKTNKMMSKTRAAGAKEIAGEKKDESGQKSELYRNTALYHKGLEHARKLNKQIRDKVHEGYSMMSHDELKNHLMKTYIKGNSEHALPYVKTHGTGGGESKKKASAHTTDPSDNDMYHHLKNAKKIHIEKSGDAGMTVHTEDKEGNKRKAFGIQVKHGNGPLTNVAILGQP